MNICCDLALEHCKAIFSQDTQIYDNVPSNEVWSQMDLQFRIYYQSCFDQISPNNDLDFKVSNQIYVHETPAYDDVLPDQIWLQKVQ